MLSKAMPRAALVLAVLALTACASTNAPSATDAPVRTVEMPVMPPVPAVLLTPPVRPMPPASGSAQDLLAHAAEYGAYVGKLETLNQGWLEWWQEQQ